MNENFRRQLDAYSFPDSIKKTEYYLKKYWLSEDEYLDKWKQIQSSIFSLKSKFPEMVFNDDFGLLINKGGLLFEQKEFEALKKCIELTKDRYFLIIEDYNELDPPHHSGPIIRLKYPIEITWKEINIEEGFSYELFGRPIRNYYIFGDSRKWGKYVANEYEFPLDILGFCMEYQALFRNYFEVSEEEKNDLKKWLPKAYIT